MYSQMERPARRCAPIKSARVARDADAEATVRALRGHGSLRADGQSKHVFVCIRNITRYCIVRPACASVQKCMSFLLLPLRAVHRGPCLLLYVQRYSASTFHLRHHVVA